MYTLTILNNFEDGHKYDLICQYLLKFHDNKKCNIVTNDRCDIPKNKFKIDCCKIKFLYKKKEIKI